MIRIDFPEPNNDAWCVWRKKCDKQTAKVIEEMSESGTWKLSELYKGQKPHYFDGDGPFFGKCAYCEGSLRKHDDLDHYRPARKVTDEEDNPIFVRNGENHKQEHPGYYWLAYDWRNLLPACSDCNRWWKLGTILIGKANRFPVEGTHAFRQGDETTEKPLLLNPVFDNPEDHLEIDSDGYFSPKEGSTKAELSIRIFGLNIRDDLRAHRRDAYKSAEKLGVSYLHARMNNHQDDAHKSWAQIEAIVKGKVPYAAAARQGYEDGFRTVSAIVDELPRTEGQ